MSENVNLGLVEEEASEYNLSLQIGGIFIILFASALGVILPLILYFFGVQNNKTIQTALLGVKTCGVGIIIATGFIHMLGDASEQLSASEENSLPKPFVEYEAWSYALAMLAIFLCALADFISLRVDMAHTDDCEACTGDHHGELTISAMEEGKPRKVSEADTVEQTQQEEVDDATDEGGYLASKWRVITLESGILVHSVLIGLDMGMQSGTTYNALLVAISFHQFFEGFALSQILIEAKLKKVWMLIAAVAFYAITTPAGIAAGVGVHSYYDEDSPSAMLTMGILDSLAGGILIYMGLTSLLANWVVNSKRLARAHWVQPFVAFLGLAVGMVSMAVVGKWA